LRTTIRECHQESSWRLHRHRDSSLRVDRTVPNTVIRIYAPNCWLRSFWGAGIAVTIAFVLGVAVSDAHSSTRPRPLTAGAVSFVVPAGWYGQIFRSAPQGSVLLQATNRPFVNGGVPKQQPGRQIVVTVLGPRRPDAGPWHSLGAGLLQRDFLPATSPRVPAGHSLAIKYFHFRGRVISVDVDFARRPVSGAMIRWLNRWVLATLKAR
jgi:hypothetical protein